MILSAGSIIARASSGSRSRINSVEPLISANSAVTVLRSPSGRFAGSSGAPRAMVCSSDRAGCAAPVELGATGSAPSIAAHSMQNLAAALFDVPHEGHCSASGAAHPSQNFAPAGFSEPHLEQRIESPEIGTTGPLVSPHAGAECRMSVDPELGTLS